jgi:hypothetical protein
LGWFFRSREEPVALFIQLDCFIGHLFIAAKDYASKIKQLILLKPNNATGSQRFYLPPVISRSHGQKLTFILDGFAKTPFFIILLHATQNKK